MFALPSTYYTHFNPPLLTISIYTLFNTPPTGISQTKMAGISNTVFPATMSQERRRENVPDVPHKRTTIKDPWVGGNVYLHDGYLAQRRDMTVGAAQRMHPPAEFFSGFSGAFSKAPTMFAAENSVRVSQDVVALLSCMLVNIQCARPAHGYAPQTAGWMHLQRPYLPTTIQTGSSLPPGMWLYPTPIQSRAPTPHTVQDARNPCWQTDDDVQFDADLQATLGPYLDQPSRTMPQSLLPHQQHPAMTNPIRQNVTSLHF
jgi:hypothetical protein